LVATLTPSGRPASLTLSWARPGGWPTELAYRENDRLASDRRPYGGAGLAGANSAEWTRLLAAFAAALADRPKVEKPVFASLEPGLALARVRVNFGARLGRPELVVFRVDPKEFALRPYHEAEAAFRDRPPVNALGWLRRLAGARLILNGGQHYPDRRAMGYLKREGQVVEPQAHQAYRGYLAQDWGRPGLYDSPAPEAQDFWSAGTILQSYMLLDRAGRVRARSSDRLASRALIGQDQEGFLWVVLVPGAMTLADAAELCLELGLALALGLDGGLEAQWAWLAPAERAEFGGYSHNNLGNFFGGGYSPTLPVALALERLSPPKAPKRALRREKTALGLKKSREGK
jgi:hypothetical protein